jgi:hypothetical protein
MVLDSGLVADGEVEIAAEAKSDFRENPIAGETRKSAGDIGKSLNLG